MKELDLFSRMYGGPLGALTTACDVLAVVGSGWVVIFLAPLALAPRTRRLAAFLAGAVAVQATLVWGLKAAVGRVRPWIRFGLPPPIGAPHDGSFPSGHAAGSFCVAAFLFVLLPSVWREAPVRARLVSLAGLALAGLIALSRVYIGAHFPLDVLAGAALGAVVGAASAELYARPLWNGRPKEGKRRAP